MNVHPHHRKYWQNSHFALLFLCVLICYWPLLNVFSAKNDNIVQFLPVRFHVTEALRQCHLPLWTPYMYLGYPIHGDIQGGAWNPLVWFLAVFGRYNLSSLHAEVLCYLFLAALGMYRLLRALNVTARLSFIGAVAFMTSGYATDVSGSNLPFLAAAAYAPFVLAYYYHLLKEKTWKYGLKTAGAMALLFVSAYPSFTICVAYILLAGFCAFFVKHKIWRTKTDWKKMTVSHFIFLLAFVGLAIPAIVSYIQILPFYHRGSGASLLEAQQNAYHPTCFLSVLLPDAPIKNLSSGSTDLISRNIYFNSFLLLALLCYARARKTFLQNFILLGVIFFALFSMGNYTPLRSWSFHWMPLMNTFRHPSNARMFVIIGSTIIGLKVIQQIDLGALSKKYLVGAGFLIIIVVAGLMTYALLQDHLPAKTGIQWDTSLNLRLRLKSFFDSLSYTHIVVINGIIQILLVGAFITGYLRVWRPQTMTLLFLANSLVFAQLAIPFTMVSKTRPSTINSILKKFPTGFPSPNLSTNITLENARALPNFEKIGIEGFYTKKIVLDTVVFTPTFMTKMQAADSNSRIQEDITSHPLAYVSTSMNIPGSLSITKFWNNGVSFLANTAASATFILQQLHLPGWKCYVDGSPVNIIDHNIIMMQINLSPGLHHVDFVYRPAGATPAFLISVLSFLIIIGLFLKAGSSERLT